MVGLGRERSEPPTSARGRGVVIPPQNLRRALVDSMHTPPAPSAGASSSAGRGGRGKKRGGGRGGRGAGRGRKVVLPSSPPPPAESPDHRSAPSQVDPSDLDPCRSPVHEPRVNELWSSSLRSTSLWSPSLGSQCLPPRRLGSHSLPPRRLGS